MQLRENKTGALSRILSYILIFSMLVCSLPLYINSVSNDEEYDLPWLWPVPGSYVLTGLDYYYSGNPHGQGQAIDIGNNGYSENIRLDVISATSGEVLYIQNSYNETTNRGSGWGNYVIVKSGNVCIIYAHLQKVTCKYGKINAGDVIGKMGNTGNSTGVHLHMQAYPYEQNSTSTDVHVFDNYINNPLYVPYFKFRSGVIKYSERYGDHLGKYYTSVDGQDYAFSGGYFGDYGQITLGATVKSIRSDGARVYAQPIKTSTQSQTVEFGKQIPVYAYYYDAYGALWYLVSENSLDKWIPESDVGFSEYVFGAEYEDKSSPKGTYGTYLDIYFAGTISSVNTIKTVRAEIRNNEGTVASFVTDVNANEFEINNTFSKGFAINGLDNGDYTYEIFVTERAYFPGADAVSKTYSVYSSDFSIDKSASDSIPPLVEEIKITYMTESAIGLSVVATDDKKIQHLLFTFVNENGVSVSFDALPDGNLYTVEVPISSLNGAGSYIITAKAYDPYMNTDESSLSLNVPSKEKGETWLVQVSSSLTVRKGPGTNYGKVESLKNNAVITVTEVVFNESDGRNWANIGTGWVALNYAVYQSGYLYNVTFNLMGGSGDISTLQKAFGQAVTIPDIIPTRNGYTFLGWSSDPASTVAEYKPGDTYSKNESANLFAVWEDKTAPVIDGVALSDKGFVSDNVTLNVIASDNSGTVYYSFDGGISFRRDGSLTVYENQTLPAKTIVVKDAAGNITEYDLDTVISNIDNVPPSIDDTTLGLTVNGGNVTFIFGDAKDDQSGIDKYTLVYSVNSDFTGAVTEEVISGHTLTLGDGVYYAMLVITDKVGNKTEEVFDRFVIGEPIKLSTPENFVIKSSSSGAAVFEWTRVNNADYYILTVSENADFTDSFDFEATDTAFSLDSLENGKIYYARLVAATYDGVYLTSDHTESVRFETVSSDNSIYSFNAFDAVIEGNNVSAKLPYSAATVDLSCKIHESAVVKYYSDFALLNEISTPRQFSFVGESVTVYIVVTAENGNKATYKLTVNRASRDAEIPMVEFNAAGETLYVGAVGNEIELNASVSDGGIITVVWYASLNGGEAQPIANGFTCSPRFVKAGSYKVYAVVTNTNEMCLNRISTYKTAEIDYTVLLNGAQIEAVINDFVYNGAAASASYALYNGDGSITYKYFSDADCTHEISAPVNSGTYYVKAFASETDSYESAESTAKKFTIKRAENTDSLNYTVIQPSLRERFGRLTVTSSGVEYSINESSYVSLEAGKTYTLNEGDVVRIRYAESLNVNASNPIEIRITPFSGTDGFYPTSGFDAREDGEYFVVNEDDLTADVLIARLAKKDNIQLYDKNGTLMNGKTDLVYSGCTMSIVDSIGVYKTLTVIILGDADRDGKVTDNDVVAIMKLSNGMSVSYDLLDSLVCDLDGDGEITSLDAAKTYNKI